MPLTTPSSNPSQIQTDVPSDTSGSYVTATAVTTRTATTHEDLSTNAKTQQLEEKTVATTTKQVADRQEQKVITQEVKTVVTSGEQQVRLVDVLLLQAET